MQGLTDGPVKTHLFRLELDTLEEAISVAEQEDFSLRQAQVSSSSYRPPRRQEYEVQNLWTSLTSKARNLAFRTISDYKNAIAVKNLVTTPMSVVHRDQYQGVLTVITDRMPKRATVAGPTLL